MDRAGDCATQGARPCCAVRARGAGLRGRQPCRPNVRLAHDQQFRRRRSGAGARTAARPRPRPAPEQPVGRARCRADRVESGRLRHRRQHRGERQGRAEARRAPDAGTESVGRVHGLRRGRHEQPRRAAVAGRRERGRRRGNPDPPPDAPPVRWPAGADATATARRRLSAEHDPGACVRPHRAGRRVRRHRPARRLPPVPRPPRRLARSAPGQRDRARAGGRHRARVPRRSAGAGAWRHVARPADHHPAHPRRVRGRAVDAAEGRRLLRRQPAHAGCRGGGCRKAKMGGPHRRARHHQRPAAWHRA